MNSTRFSGLLFMLYRMGSRLEFLLVRAFIRWKHTVGKMLLSCCAILNIQKKANSKKQKLKFAFEKVDYCCLHIVISWFFLCFGFNLISTFICIEYMIKVVFFQRWAKKTNQPIARRCWSHAIYVVWKRNSPRIPGTPAARAKTAQGMVHLFLHH